jgi:hypothetical protein
MTERPTLTEPLDIAKFWKNRRGESIRVTLSTFEGHNLISVRTWFTDSKSGQDRPAKGFTSNVKHLPRLIAELTKAEAKARELGLIETTIVDPGDE